jgi:hypothetical protein
MQNNDTVIVFLTLLAILCQVFIVCIGVFEGLALASQRVKRPFQSTVAALAPVAAPFAFGVALVTMLGSLYMSEVKHFTPCHLCWIQRGLLYPQVLWTLLLWIKPDLTLIRRVAYVMLVADIPVSIYHYVLEWYPNLETSVCSLKTPCSLVWFREYHYLSLPLMALTSALTVLILLIISARTD